MSIPTTFQPAGSTFCANATTTSGAITMTWGLPAASFNITNTGTSPVFYRLTVNASPTATIPAAGSSSAGQMINGGDSQTIQLPVVDANGSALYVTTANIAVITATGSSLVYIQPVVSI